MDINKRATRIKLAATEGHFYLTLTLETYIWLAFLVIVVVFAVVVVVVVFLLLLLLLVLLQRVLATSGCVLVALI